MSYILDALKKSEAERQKSLPAGQEALSLTDAPARKPVAAWALAGLAALAALAAGAYLLGQRHAPAAPAAEPNPAGQVIAVVPHDRTGGGRAAAPARASRPAPQTQAVDQTAAAGGAPASGAAQTSSATREAKTALAPTAAPSQSAGAAPVALGQPAGTDAAAAPASRSILRFADLPSRLQAKVPNLRVTTHIYSSDPSLRMATVNGIPRKEGADLGSGLKLAEVTESGILLEIEGRLFALDILEEWQLP